MTQPIEKTPVILKNPKNWHIIINAMEGVIPYGTGFQFGETPYSVAAKTGTAQVRSDNGRIVDSSLLPLNERPNSIFIAFAPVKHPKIAIAVVVEHQPLSVVDSVARKVMDYYLLHEHHFRIKPS